MHVSTAVLCTLVSLAAVWDVSQRRIPNRLVFPGIVVGLAFQAQSGGFAGLGLSLLGIATALAILIGPFAFRLLGGGDVKLAMLCGAFTSWLGAIEIILIGTVLHGMLALIVVLSSRVFVAFGRPPPFADGLPHAVGFAVATLLYTSNVIRLF